MTPANAGKRYPPEPLPDADVWRIINADLPRRDRDAALRDRALLAVTYRGALRISEALDIELRDIGFVGARDAIRVRNGKGGKARTVAIGNGALALLDRWLERRAALGFDDDAPVFCSLPTRGAKRRGASGGGHRLDSAHVRRLLPKLAAAAGIRQRVAPHTLRHSRAIDLDNRGVPLNVIRDSLGHSLSTVTDRYLRGLNPRAVIEAMSVE
jgi:site-specific recombinase XerD